MRVPDLDRWTGALLGLAAGDAIGAAVEFHARGTFEPVTGMRGGGPFGLAPGEWTDDTSMALCLASSLLECDGFDAADQMRRYWRWVDAGEWSSNGRCFDIGRTVGRALQTFRATGAPMAGPTDPASAGNGSLMRLAPVALFYHPDAAAIARHAADSSRTTHGAEECVDACRLFAGMLHRALSGASREAVLLGDAGFAGAPRIADIARGRWLHKGEDQIRGRGYVVDSLEAALWSFAHADGFEAAVLRAANLGDDADTTAAVCGQLAGAHYGRDAIPEPWLAVLARRREIEAVATALHAASARRL